MLSSYEFHSHLPTWGSQWSSSHHEVPAAILLGIPTADLLCRGPRGHSPTLGAPGRSLMPPALQCRMECRDVPAETLYDVLHDIEYRKKWDTNVIETFDIGRLTANSDVGYYACEEGPGGSGRSWGRAESQGSGGSVVSGFGGRSLYTSLGGFGEGDPILEGGCLTLEHPTRCCP